MKQIGRIFRRDIKNIFTNSMAIILAAGVLILPSLYAWVNIYANWDPYGKASTGNMKIAVMIEDKGVTFRGIGINIGEQIGESLRANDVIDWQFLPKEEGVNGVLSGQYYAAIEIPEDFSESLVSIISDDFEPPQITYYANEKKNAIATKITDKVVQTVQGEVNTTFIKTIADVISKLVGAVLPGGGRGYRITLGGHWGRTGAAGREVPSLLPDEESVLAFIEKVLTFYRSNGLPGERFCKLLDRLGFEQVLSET